MFAIINLNDNLSYVQSKKFVFKHPKLYRLYQRLYYELFKRHIFAVTGPIRVLPDFIIIGAKRCGTTSLYHYFGEHPCIVPSVHDKLGFFDDNFNLGINWYKSLFPTILHKQYVKFRKKKFMSYDVTSTYIQNPEVAKRIKQLLPNIKLIAILRNPADRAYSEYNLSIKKGIQTLSFEEVVNIEIEKIRECEKKLTGVGVDFFTKSYNYLARGLYAKQLKTWFELFPRNQLLVISTEDLSLKPHKTLAEVFQFLNLPNYKIRNLERRSAEKYQKMGSNIRQILIGFFRPYNSELFKMIGKSFDWDQ